MDNAVHVQQQESVLAGGDEAPWQAVRIQELAALATEHVGLLLPGVEAFVAVVPPHRRPRAIVAAATQGWRERLLGRAFELPPDHVERPQETLERAHRLLPPAAVAHAVPLASGLPPGDSRSGLGLMVFFRLEARFTEAEVRLMEELARRLGAAMQRSELVSVEVAADRLQAATDAALDLGGSLEPDKVVERMLRRAADEADADVAGLHFVTHVQILSVRESGPAPKGEPASYVRQSLRRPWTPRPEPRRPRWPRSPRPWSPRP
jgi:GAF domain-containing protein